MPKNVAKQRLIPRFQPGVGVTSAFSAKDMNRIVDAVNSILCGRIKRGNRDDYIVSDNNVVWQLQKSGSGDSSGTGVTVGIYYVKVVNSDYLKCISAADEAVITEQIAEDEAETYTWVNIAKPPLLRTSLATR